MIYSQGLADALSDAPAAVVINRTICPPEGLLEISIGPLLGPPRTAQCAPGALNGGLTKCVLSAVPTHAADAVPEGYRFLGRPSLHNTFSCGAGKATCKSRKTRAPGRGPA